MQDQSNEEVLREPRRSDFATLEEYEVENRKFNDECEEVKFLKTSLHYYRDDHSVDEFIIVKGGTKRARHWLIKGQYEPTFCQHSYDCCGRWYTSEWPLIVHDDDVYNYTVFKTSRYQNV